MKPPASSDSGVPGALVLALALLAGLAALALATRPILPVDETRYVGVAWEMWLRGDFLVPFKNGEPYSHKPPLLFWLFHAGWALFGVNDWWPRLVMPLFSAASLGQTWSLARRLWPARPGLGGQAALVLASSFCWLLYSTMLMFDVMLACWVLLGMHGLLAAADGKRRGVFMLGLAIGLGVLGKGPVILLHLLPAALLAPWWNRSPHAASPTPGRWYGGVLLAVLLGAAIALAWAIPAGQVGGEAYRNAIFWGQTADRMVDSFAHSRPAWWYLPLLPLLLFPWMVWPGLWRALAQLRRDGLDRGARFCLAWIVPVFVAFSFISGKQPHYLLPLFPAFALLAARALAGQAPGRVGVPALLAALIGGALMLAASGHIAAVREQAAVPPLLWPGAALLALAALTWWAGRRGFPAISSLAALGAATLAAAQLAAMPVAQAQYDLGPMARAIGLLQAQGASVANAAAYHAQYQFPGRLRAPLVELRGGAIQPWLAAHPGAYAVVYLGQPPRIHAAGIRRAQPYRGGWAVLANAPTAAVLLAAERE